MKEETKLEDFDFGFTMMDEDALDAVQEARQEVQNTSSELQEQVDDWKSRTETLYRMVIPLLKNLATNPEKDYIYWPDRVEKIQQFKDKLDEVAGK